MSPQPLSSATHPSTHVNQKRKMTMPNLRLVLDTYKLNFNMTQWPVSVLDAFEEPALIADTFHKQVAAIDANRNLSHEGRKEARRDAAKAALEAINKWQTPKLTVLDGQIAQQRTALVPPTPQPDPRTVDHMVSQLQRFSPQEIAVLYGSATDAERVLMEAASASLGRVPLKSEQGLEWTPLLAPDVIDEAVLARAMTSNPTGVQRVEELSEIRSMYATVAGIATADVQDVLSGG